LSANYRWHKRGLILYVTLPASNAGFSYSVAGCHPP
jgi:hypothetical protein